LVTSGSKPDRSALDVVLEIENVANEAVELSWTGYIPLGFASFRLEDAQANDVEPSWRFGGNAPSGNARALFRKNQTIRYDIHRGPFTPMMGKRALRIGTFWGRELPTDGTSRSLRATITGAAAIQSDAATYEGVDSVSTPPPARAFVGTLDIPAVCIE